MKNICKFFRVILCLAAVFAVLALLARRLSRGHAGHRYRVSKDRPDGDCPRTHHSIPAAGHPPAAFASPCASPGREKGSRCKGLTPHSIIATRRQGNPLPLLHTLLICPHTMAGI